MTDDHGVNFSDEDDDSDNGYSIPEMQGTLSKWTNYIHGWQSRFIVFKDGTLSYYKSEQEAGFGCRGSIGLNKATVKPHEFDECRFDVSVNDCVWYLRAENPDAKQQWVSALESYKAESGYGSENNLKRHGSAISLTSNTLSTTSTSSFKKGRGLKEKLAEMETFRDILCRQIETLQGYFDACAEADSSTKNNKMLEIGAGNAPFTGITNKETGLNIMLNHSTHAMDFKGEALTFKATTAGVLTTLQHCLEVVGQREDMWRKRLEKEAERRRKVEELYRESRREALSVRLPPHGSPDYEYTDVHISTPLLIFPSPLLSLLWWLKSPLRIQKLLTKRLKSKMTRDEEQSSKVVQKHVSPSVLPEYAQPLSLFHQTDHDTSSKAQLLMDSISFDMGTADSLSDLFDPTFDDTTTNPPCLKTSPTNHKELINATMLETFQEKISSSAPPPSTITHPIPCSISVTCNSRQQSHLHPSNNEILIDNLVKRSFNCFLLSTSYLKKHASFHSQSTSRKEGPHSALPDEEFYDAVETGLDKLDEDDELRDRLKSKLPIAKTTFNATDHRLSKYLKKEPDEEYRRMFVSRLSSEIERVSMEQLHYARMPVGEGGWQLFAEDGEMKMYKREEEVNGMVVDPLKACHVVKGVTGHEMCHYFFCPDVRSDWETTLEQMTVVETVSEDTLVFLQVHKRIWPASQRDALFWSHMKHVPDSKDVDGHDIWIVCNHSTDHPDFPANTGKCVRVYLTICLVCQTCIDPPKDGAQITRDNITCKITYCSVVNPGGWAPASVLRAVYKREYPKFLKRFTGYVIDQCKDKPIMF